MNEVIDKEDIKVEDMIYEIRGKQVMLDSDLARLYQVMTGNLNKAVKRNLERFPERFMFQLTKEEYDCLIFQNGISKGRGGLRKMPYVFTEQGVAMLSSVLHSTIAVNVSIRIMDAFVRMRHYIGNNEYRLSNVESKVIEHDEKIKLLNEVFEKFDEKSKVNEIYLKGETYSAYSKIVDIFNMTKKELIIIDSYADKSVLDMVSNIKLHVILITSDKSRLKKIDIDKYNSEFDNLTIIYNNDFHDRYFIIDKNIIYHCGTSINNAGSKIFSINLLEDTIVKDNLISYVCKILSIKSV